MGSDWGENLALAEFAMNTVKNSSIDMSPFNLVHLREPLWPGTLEKPALDVPAVEEMTDRCFAIFRRARDFLELVSCVRNVLSFLKDGQRHN